MALSYAMHWIEENHHAVLTNYGEFLERFPPRWEAEVFDDSSWSCAHGVERWRSNCGCNGGRPGWNQLWRGPLREALDLLRDRTAPLAEAVAKPLLKISGLRATPTSASFSIAAPKMSTVSSMHSRRTRYRRRTHHRP